MPRFSGDVASSAQDKKVKVAAKHDELPKHSLLGSVSGFLKDAPAKYTPEVVKRVAGRIYDAAPSRKIVVPVVGTAAVFTGGVVGASYLGGVDVVSLLNYLRPSTLALSLPALPTFAELVALVSPYALPATSVIAGGYGVNRIRNLSKQNAELVAALNRVKLDKDNSLEARKAELDALEESIENAQADVMEAKKALSKEKRALNKDKKTLAADQAALTDKQNELEEEEKQQQATAKHQKSKQVQLSATEARLADKERKLEDLENDLRALEKQLDAESEQLKEAQEAFEAAKAEFEQERSHAEFPEAVPAKSDQQPEVVTPQGAPILTSFANLRAATSITVPKPTRDAVEEHSLSDEEKVVRRTPSRSPSPVHH